MRSKAGMHVLLSDPLDAVERVPDPVADRQLHAFSIMDLAALSLVGIPTTVASMSMVVRCVMAAMDAMGTPPLRATVSA